MDKYHGIKKINEKGQFVVEAVLVSAVVVGCFLAFTKIVREQQLVQKIFQKPITNLRTMVGYGTWKESCKGLGSSSAAQRLANCHPNSISRALSSNPN